MEISVFWKNMLGGGHKPLLIHRHGIVTYAEMKALVTRACASIRRLKIPVGVRIIGLPVDQARASAAFIAANLEGHVPVMLPFDIGAGATILPDIRRGRTVVASAG